MSTLSSRCAGFPTRLTQALLAPWSRFGILVALLTAAVALVVACEPQRMITEGWITRSAGSLSVLSFAAAFATCTAACVPRPLLNVAGGALFGAQMGLVAGLTGTVLGAAASFGAGRLLGQDALRPLLKSRLLRAADRQMSRHGFRSMLVLRLLPGVPFAGSNVAAAVSRVRWPAFLTASALGSAPSTAAYVVAGSHASTPTSPAFVAAFSFIALTGLGGAFVAWRRRRKRRAAAAPFPEAADRALQAGAAPVSPAT